MTALPSAALLAVLSVLGATLLITRWFNARRLRLSREAYARENHCAPPKEVYLGGIEVLIDSIFGGYAKFKAERRSNEIFSEKFREHGDTFALKEPAGTSVFFTVDPANIKAAFALDFNSWGIAPALPARHR